MTRPLPTGLPKARGTSLPTHLVLPSLRSGSNDLLPSRRTRSRPCHGIRWWMPSTSRAWWILQPSRNHPDLFSLRLPVHLLPRSDARRYLLRRSPMLACLLLCTLAGGGLGPPLLSISLRRPMRPFIRQLLRGFLNLNPGSTGVLGST